MRTASPGIVYITTWMSWDKDIHRGFMSYNTKELNTVDDGDFTYDFRGGPECISFMTRIGSAWDAFFLDEWADLPTHVENSTKRGSTTAAVAAGATSFSVGVGQGANFTIGNDYFLLSLDKMEACEYVTIANVVGDVITVDDPVLFNFKSGSELTAYHLRVYATGNQVPSLITSSPLMTLPLSSDRGKEWGFSSTTVNYSAAEGDVNEKSIIDGAPNHKGEYVVQQPTIKEYFGNAGWYAGNRMYGIAKNQWFTAKLSMLQMGNGRTILGDVFAYYMPYNNISWAGVSTIAAMIPDTDKDS